jgi:hypothetical protein
MARPVPLASTELTLSPNPQVAQIPIPAADAITPFLASQEARALGVDTLIAPNLYGEILKILDEDENVDMLLATSDPGRPCTQSVVEAAETIKKPPAVILFALPEFVTEEYAFLTQTLLA